MKKEIKSGSTKELWQMLAPLCISMFSTFAMLFVDRIMLAKFSTEALTAATSGGTLNWMLTGMFVAIASMSGVFVSQHNGARRYEMLARPVWQMVYFAGISTVMFWGVAQVGVNFLLSKKLLNDGQAEFLTFNYFNAPLYAYYTALTTFYIGQGKTSLVKWVGLVGNLTNVVLDYFFIFGLKNLIPAMGIKGASIATGLGVLMQILILKRDFLSKRNREEFFTNNLKFDYKVFSDCVKKGAASAVSLFFELMGWSAYYFMVREKALDQSVIASIGQSIFLFFIFFGQALEKSSSAIAGNLIGAQNFKELKKLFISGIKLSSLFGGVTIISLTIFSDQIVEIFISDTSGSLQINITSAMKILIKEKFHIIMPLLGLYIMLENFRWLVTGILIAGGKNLYTMVVNTASIWIFMVFPAFYAFVIKNMDIVVGFYIFIFHSAITFAVFAIKNLKTKYDPSTESN